MEDPFITLDLNSTLKGVAIWYPEQDPKKAPVPYPWTIVVRHSNGAVLDVELRNSYQGIHILGERHTIRGVQGTMLRRGIYVEFSEDICRIENIHLHSMWAGSGPHMDLIRAEGEAFIFQRADWLYLSNCFTLRFKVGYHFIDDMANVLLTQCGADDAQVAVRVDDSVVLSTNCGGSPLPERPIPPGDRW